MMKKRAVSSMLGGTGVREPVILSGEHFYIRLLSVYEAIVCESNSRDLTQRLIKDGADKRLAESVSENACLAAMCLCDSRDKAVFPNGFSALNALTPEELLKVAQRYTKVKSKFLEFHQLTSKMVEGLKKN